RDFCLMRSGRRGALRHNVLQRNEMGSKSLLNPATLERVTDDIDAAAEVQFFRQTQFVAFNRLDAHGKRVGNLFVRESLSGQYEDTFFLAARDRCQRPAAGGRSLKSDCEKF